MSEEESVGRTIGRTVSTTLGIGFGLTLAVFLTCAGAFVSCAGLSAIGQQEAARIEREELDSIVIEDVRLSSRNMSAPGLIETRFVLKLRNQGPRALGGGGFLVFTDDAGFEVDRETVTLAVEPGAVQSFSGVLIGRGTPTTVAFRRFW